MKTIILHLVLLLPVFLQASQKPKDLSSKPPVYHVWLYDHEGNILSRGIYQEHTEAIITITNRNLRLNAKAGPSRQFYLEDLSKIEFREMRAIKLKVRVANLIIGIFSFLGAAVLTFWAFFAMITIPAIIIGGFIGIGIIGIPLMILLAIITFCPRVFRTKILKSNGNFDFSVLKG